MGSETGLSRVGKQRKALHDDDHDFNTRQKVCYSDNISFETFEVHTDLTPESYKYSVSLRVVLMRTSDCDERESGPTLYYTVIF